MYIDILITKEPESNKSLEDIAKKLLRAAGVGETLPTPQDDIIKCAELVKGGQINLDDYDESFINKVNNALSSGWRKWKGMLFIRERTIYIKPDVPESQIPFITFHEVGHKVIPWQKDAYYFDDNYSLSPEVEWEFDKEANYISAQLIFQGRRFEKEARDYKLSIETGIKLAQDYGASCHSTLWQYVSTNTSVCTLLVMKEGNYNEMIDGMSNKPFLLQYIVPSPPFKEEFGTIKWKRKFSPEHEFVVVAKGLNDNIVKGETILENKNGEKVKLIFEAWSNKYNVFVLIYKKPKISLLKKQVILTK